jgi:acyl-CoA synthetase (AMP-forming)/AMP-acid ligase II
VRELFGSTETCILARRRTASEEAWTLLPGVDLHPQPDGTLVHAAHLGAPVALADIVELLPGGRFRLRGRQSDLLEIAGKRASLADLTHRLLAIPGVSDAALVQLEPDANGIRRLAPWSWRRAWTKRRCATPCAARWIPCSCRVRCAWWRRCRATTPASSRDRRCWTCFRGLDPRANAHVAITGESPDWRCAVPARTNPEDP